MDKFASIFTAIVTVLRTYPAMSAALLNVGVALLAYFGLHVTAQELAGYVTVASIVLGMLVHANVIPVVKANRPNVTIVNSGDDK